jgi:hypothetical protein
MQDAAASQADQVTDQLGCPGLLEERNRQHKQFWLVVAPFSSKTVPELCGSRALTNRYHLQNAAFDSKTWCEQCLERLVNPDSRPVCQGKAEREIRFGRALINAHTMFSISRPRLKVCATIEKPPKTAVAPAVKPQQRQAKPVLPGPRSLVNSFSQVCAEQLVPVFLQL